MRHVASAFLLSALALALFGTLPAAAKPTDAQLEAIKANCRSDFMSNCWGVKRGGVEAFQCLKEHMASLSTGCQTAVKAATPPPAAPAPATPAKAPESAPAAPAPAAAAPPAPAPAPAATQPAPATQPTAETPPPAPASEAKTATPEPAPASSPQAIAAPAAAPPAPAAAIQSAAPAPAAAAPEAMPPIIGFIPPRKKIMVQRNCREDLKTYCADVDLGDGRVLRCLLNNRAALTPDCQGALARLSQ